MTFKKAFNIGYLIFVILLIAIYFLIPDEYYFVGVITLCVLFGIYQIVINSRLKQNGK